MFYTIRQEYVHIYFEKILYDLRSTKIKVPNYWAQTLRSTKEKSSTIWLYKIYTTGQNNKFNE